MEPLSSNLRKKIIVTVRVSDVHPELFTHFKPFNENCYDVYKRLLKKYGDVFLSPSFISFLKGLSYMNAMGGVSFFFDDRSSFSGNSVFVDERFIKWEGEEKNKIDFLSELIKTNEAHLIRKHESLDIFVAPILNDKFHIDNVDYVEALINAIMKDDDEVFLLVHDSDLYSEGLSSHQVAWSDDGLGIKKEDMTRYQRLFTLIDNKRVFVFKHDRCDDYYNRIVLKLNDDEESTLEDIILKLDPSNYSLMGKLEGLLMKSDIKDALDKAVSEEVFDFSNPFFNYN